MKTGNALHLSIYGLCLMLTFFGHGTGVLLPEPQPVDCLYSSWSTWTPCNPCTNERRRSRGIEAFGQFKGQPCREPLGDSEACVAIASCAPPSPSQCLPGNFQCSSGACIKKRLVCNSDYDCEDHMDEDVCARTPRKPCGTRKVGTSDRGRSDMGQGINILGSTPRKKLLYNGYFNGACQLVSDIRLPWNVAVLNLETRIEKTLSSRIDDSTQHLLHVLSESYSYVRVALSIQSVPVINMSVVHESRNVIEEIVESIGKRFVRINSKVQTASYRLRSRDLRVTGGFIKDVGSLPVEYEKGTYFTFIEDYGTHYSRSGNLGGEYDLIYVLDTHEIKKRNITEINLQGCFDDIYFNTGAGATGNARTSSCKISNKAEWKAVVPKVLISVKGGDAASTSALKESINIDGEMNTETYQKWLRSIPNYPGLLHSEQEPIYNVFPLNMPDANARISNMKHAIVDYVAEYNVCKCKPCHNNGTAVLVDGMCSCLCKPAYKGLACQNHDADKGEPRHCELSPREPSPRDPSPSVPSPRDPSPRDPSPRDPSPSDPSPRDTRPRDTRPRDPSPSVPSPRDPSPRDPSPRDTRPRDTSPRDTRPRDPSPSVPSPRDPSPRDSSPSVPSPSDPSPSVPSPSMTHDGQWACWSGWSACSDEGERIRERECNVEGLPPGGVCSGEDTHAEGC